MTSLRMIMVLIVIVLLSASSCTVISDKASKKADKENAYLSTFLNKPLANLSSTFGKPTQTLVENNQTVHVYEIK